MDWNNIVSNALSAFRNLFFYPTAPVNRKRRAPEANDEFPYRVGKTRRLNSSGMIRDYINLDDEPLSNTERGRRLISNIKSQEIIDLIDDGPTSPSTTKRSPTFKTPPFRPVETILLDDNDIITIKRGNEMRFQRLSSRPTTYTSTPAANGTKQPYQNGMSDEDDVILVKDVKPARKTIQDKYNFSNFKPFKGSSFLNSLQNGTKPKEYPPLSVNVAKRRSIKTDKPLSIVNESVRLEDRENYKKLLESLSSGNENSVYFTPTGKVYEYDNVHSSRSQKILNMSRKSPKDTSKMSTKETIKKFLDDFENEPVVIKDSDSESDVLIVSPPSPKPDVKVDPVNSLKKIVDTSESTKKDWIDDIVAKYKKQISVRQKVIEDLKTVSKKHEQINNELRLERLVDRVNKALQIREAVLPEEEEAEEPELPVLSKEQQRLVERAFTRSDLNEVLARKFNLNITRKDLLTLSDLHWLNDEVINFYMNLIIQRSQNTKWPKAYAFNTFFYTKLTKDGPQSLRRWTKRVDLFEHDLICVPIHLGMHWCMSIIDFRDKSIKYYDSMGGNNNKCLDSLLNYLEVEHMDKKKTPYDTSDFILENVKDVPQQLNGSDCGMFSCTFAEFATRNAKFNFSQEHMPYLRHKMVVEIMLGELLIQ